LEVPIAHDPERFLEIVVLRASKHTSVAEEPAVLSMTVVSEPQIELPKDTPREKPVPQKQPKALEDPVTSVSNQELEAPAPMVKAAAPLDEALWPEILTALKKRHNTLYGVVRMAQPRFSNEGLQLVFAFAFHQKRISEAGNRQVLADIIKDLTGDTFTIECLVDKSAKPPKITVHAEKAIPPASDIKAISNIFGSAELLES
jgi:hypothetical protein